MTLRVTGWVGRGKCSMVDIWATLCWVHFSSASGGVYGHEPCLPIWSTVLRLPRVVPAECDVLGCTYWALCSWGRRGSASTNCFSELVGRHQGIRSSFLPLVMNSRRECTKRDASLQSICLRGGFMVPSLCLGSRELKSFFPTSLTPQK